MNLDLEDEQVFEMIQSSQMTFEEFYSWLSIQRDRAFETGVYQQQLGE